MMKVIQLTVRWLFLLLMIHIMENVVTGQELHTATQGCTPQSMVEKFKEKDIKGYTTFETNVEATVAYVRCCGIDKTGEFACETPGKENCPAKKAKEKELMKTSYGEAKKICKKLKKTLCTMEQIANGLCCATGCGFDKEGVWIKDGPHTAMQGCPQQKDIKIVETNPDAVDASVRCCGKNKATDGTKRVTWTCETPTPCAKGKKYGEAKKICKKLGKKVCTKDQITSGICCGTGCNSDIEAVWIRDGPPPPKM